MSSVNKQSLREEFDAYRNRFQTLSAEGKVSAEVSALIKGMMILFELILAVFLEKATTKSPKNSGKPPSQTEKDETASTPGSKKKGRRENDEAFNNSRTRESVRIAKVVVCDCCGEDLGKVKCLKHERRTRIDIHFEKVVAHVDAEIKTCPNCKASTKGTFPSNMPGPVQYGDGIKAYALSLLVAQMVALKRIQNMLKTLIGIVISEATLLKYVTRLYLALETWERQSIDYLKEQPVMHVDETSLRVDRKNHWIHVYSSGEVTLKLLHAKRGKEAMKSFNIIPRYGGIIIHDCWASYLSYDHCEHGLCGAHLLRELVFVMESNGYNWASNMKRLLQETCAKVSRRKRKKLTTREYAGLQKRYRNILTRGESEMPPIPARQNGKRGKVAKSDAHNLLERLRDHEAAVLLFAKNAYVSFTNNRAERDLRMSKVKQKVSGCFRKEHYAKAYCRISSYLQTMANRGYNPLAAIQMALSGQLYADTGE